MAHMPFRRVNAEVPHSSKPCRTTSASQRVRKRCPRCSSWARKIVVVIDLAVEEKPQVFGLVGDRVTNRGAEIDDAGSCLDKRPATQAVDPPVVRPAISQARQQRFGPHLRAGPVHEKARNTAHVASGPPRS